MKLNKKKWIFITMFIFIFLFMFSCHTIVLIKGAWWYNNDEYKYDLDNKWRIEHGLKPIDYNKWRIEHGLKPIDYKNNKGYGIKWRFIMAIIPSDISSN